MIKFDFASPMVADIGGNLDYMPQGLLGSKDAPYSAETYLRNITAGSKCNMLTLLNCNVIWKVTCKVHQSLANCINPSPL